jgi:H+-transporting ATPase
VVPADARIICDYDNKDGFAQYHAELSAQDVMSPRAEKFEEGEEDDEGVPHIGHSILAIDQSAMTGESLAVDKCESDLLASPTLPPT